MRKKNTIDRQNERKPGIALIYVRVSDERKNDPGYSPESQEEQCRLYCEKKQLIIEKIYVDRNQTGRNMNRTAFIELVSRVFESQGEITSVVAFKRDRIARNTVEYLSLKTQFKTHGVDLCFVDFDPIDGAVGKYMEVMLAGAAEFESDINSERTALNMDQARREGRIVYKAPIGFLNAKDHFKKSRIVQDEERVPFVRKAFRLMATGKFTATEVLDRLNEEGFKTRKGNPVSRQTFYRMLVNDIYQGRVTQKNGISSVKGNFESIIDSKLFNRVQSVLEKNDVLSVDHNTDRDEFPLRRFVKCAKCEASLTGGYCTGRHGKKYPYYKCWKKECDGLNVRTEFLEKEFLSFLSKLSPTPELLDLLEAIVKEKWDERASQLQDKHNQNKSELEKNKDYIDKLTDKLVKGIIPDDIYKQKVAEMRGRINALESEIENFNIKHCDIFMILLRVRRVLENPSKTCQEANGQQRRNIQKALFPLGVLYSKERGLETPQSTSVYNLLRLYEDLRNDMATPTGIEPVLPA